MFKLLSENEKFEVVSSVISVDYCSFHDYNKPYAFAFDIAERRTTKILELFSSYLNAFSQRKQLKGQHLRRGWPFQIF